MVSHVTISNHKKVAKFIKNFLLLSNLPVFTVIVKISFSTMKIMNNRLHKYHFQL